MTIGFVDLGQPLLDDAVDRDSLAWAHDDHVVEGDPSNRNLHLGSSAPDPGGFGPKGQKGTDRVGGLPLGSRFESAAEEDQRDHHSRRFEVKLRRVAGASEKEFVGREAEGRTGAEGDQEIHVAGAGLQGFPARAVKPGAEPELHQRCEGQLKPAREHPRASGQFARHRQKKRERQKGRNEHMPLLLPVRRKPPVLAFGPGSTGLCGWTSFVSGLFDRSDQKPDRHLAGCLDGRPAVREIDARSKDAGDLAKGLFDAGHAGRAGQARDVQRQKGWFDIISGRPDRLDEVPGRDARWVGPDVRAGSRDVHGGFGDAGNPGQDRLDPGDARRTGHPLNLKTEAGQGWPAMLLHDRIRVLHVCRDAIHDAACRPSNDGKVKRCRTERQAGLYSDVELGRTGS